MDVSEMKFEYASLMVNENPHNAIESQDRMTLLAQKLKKVDPTLVLTHMITGEDEERSHYDIDESFNEHFGTDEKAFASSESEQFFCFFYQGLAN